MMPKIPGFDFEEFVNDKVVLRCHACDTRAAYTVPEAAKGLKCLTCFPVVAYPSEPAIQPKRRRRRQLPATTIDIPPEKRLGLIPSNDFQRTMCRIFAGGDFNFCAIARRHHCSAAYVEKIYYKNWLVPRLLERIEALEAKKAPRSESA